MAKEGYDMFIGGKRDPSFGPVVFFGYGGVYVEVFKDIQMILCPEVREDIAIKVKMLKSHQILAGARGKGAGNIDAYVEMIYRLSYLLMQFPQIQEIDVNPARVLSDGSGAVALDARVRISET
jgi:acyl-CoA synthetase (NDP forming)